MDNKISCSVGVLTLNCADSLDACFDSLKDFAEIIICDGNSTDNTIEIAKKYGAKVIKQYDSDESNLKCIMDKANVRQKNMNAASFDWYFFMDADDTLSQKAAEEIRGIVSSNSKEFLVYKMPTRIFIEDQEIKYEATYPSYQTRLVNRKINPYFKGRVHDRIEFDRLKHKVGLMKNYYNFHWSRERVENYWEYLKKYIKWETETAEFSGFLSFIYWSIYRRLKTILGYVLYRLPKMYFLRGFKGTMPLKIELMIVRYHIYLLFFMTWRHFFDSKAVVFIREIINKKDLARILANFLLKNKECHGEIIDIGGGKERASHYRFLKMIKWNKIKTIDINPQAKPNFVLNIENEKIPISGDSRDFVFAFNVLEHLKNSDNLLSEANRILKKGGELVGSVPFLVNVHPDPHDYARMTKEKLETELKSAGFSKIEVKIAGAGPFTAGFSQIEFLMPRLIKLIIIPFIFLGDFLIGKIKPSVNFKERFPLSYVFEAVK